MTLKIKCQCRNPQSIHSSLQAGGGSGLYESELVDLPAKSPEWQGIPANAPALRIYARREMPKEANKNMKHHLGKPTDQELIYYTGFQKLILENIFLIGLYFYYVLLFFTF